MAGLLDGFYALSDEERYYRDLYLKGRSRAEYINLPAEVEASARLEEKIVLSSGYYSDEDRASVIVLKHPNAPVSPFPPLRGDVLCGERPCPGEHRREDI